MADEAPGEGQALARRSAKLYAVGRILIWFVPVPFAAILLTPGVWRIPVALVVVAVYVGAAWRGWRIEFRCDSKGVVIVNQWRTYRFTWEEVRQLTVIGTRFPAVAFVLTDGRVPTVQASSYSRSLRTTAWSIAKTFAPETVERDDDATVWNKGRPPLR
jgi:hypothetical protein